MINISIIVPTYKCEKCILKLFTQVKESLSTAKIVFEIIFVNDKSPDNSWKEILEIAKNNSELVGVNLSKNFGQHAAITAGLSVSKGDWVVVMDCDLQDNPNEIVNLYKYAQSFNFDCVFARRMNRKHNFIKNVTSLFFYKFFNWLTDAYFDPAVGNFGICKRQVILEFLNLGDKFRNYPALIHWLGFNIGYIDVAHGESERGQSSYTISKLVEHAINTIIAFSDKPLRLSIRIGFFISLASAIVGVFFLSKKIFLGIDVSGWTSLIISIWFFGGVILLNLGIIGLYIGKTFDQTKKRPLFIIKETTNKI